MAHMAPSTSLSAYAYQKPSTIATRSLVTGTKPTETTSTSSYDADVTQDRPALQRKTTDHYAQAVQAAASKSEPADASTKPPLERQQSWKHSDLKRGAMEKILGDDKGAHGYTSTNAKP